MKLSDEECRELFKVDARLFEVERTLASKTIERLNVEAQIAQAAQQVMVARDERRRALLLIARGRGVREEQQPSFDPRSGELLFTEALSTVK